MEAFSYKVFLSFHGADTRRSFVSHLYEELRRKSVYTFKDDETFPRGSNIEVILDAIQESRSALIILSRNYASSIWCLKELSKIMECRVTHKQIVVPIFYLIDPSELTKDDGSYEAALIKHEADFAKEFSGDENKLKEEMEKLQRWKEDLKQVCSISGWPSGDGDRDEADFIEEIVDDINNQLVCQSSSDAENLVGMSENVDELNKMLEIQKDDVVRMVGITGIDGIGKKTIARFIFNKHFRDFDGGCVLPNVGKRIRKNALSELKKELVSKTIKKEISIQWPLDRDSNIIKEMLGSKKVLIVLEDVDGFDQLECLAEPSWFKLGSRIIITASDKQLLTAHGVEHTYQVPYLGDKPASRLFCQYAFGTKQPKEGYWELSRTFLNKVKGFPFALKILGGFLRGKSPQQWTAELRKEPNEHPSMELQDIMKRIYDCLSTNERDAFLDIACFFNGENLQFVSDMLRGCGFEPDATLGVLQDKAIITTSDNKVFMHKLLQDMGRQNVQKKPDELGQMSRLWNFEHIKHVLSKYTEGHIEGIFFNTAKRGGINIHCDGFKGLGKLRLLKLYNSLSNKCNVKLDSLSSISKLLRLFHWPEFPLDLLPEEFCPKHLVVLNLPGSKIRKLWSGQQSLEKLLSVDLGQSGLTELPDLSKAKNLKILNLQDCKDLVDVSSIEHLPKVEYLNFEHCKKLRDLPNMKKLTSLRTLRLSNCSRLEKMGQLPANVKCLHLCGTAIKEFSVPPGCKLILEELETNDCPMLEIVPSQISETKSLKIFNVANSPGLLRKLCRVKTDAPNEEEEYSTTSSNDRSLEGSKLLQNPLVAGLGADVHETLVPPTYSVVEPLSNSETNSIVISNTPISTANETTGKLCGVKTDIANEEEEEETVTVEVGVEMSKENFYSQVSESQICSMHDASTEKTPTSRDKGSWEEEKEEDSSEKLSTSLQVQHAMKTSLSTTKLVQIKDTVPPSCASVIQNLETGQNSRSNTNQYHEPFLASVTKADKDTESHVGGTSSVDISSAEVKLKKLLEMELQELGLERLTEASELINLLEKENKHFSKEQRSCLMQLKELQKWGSSFQENDKVVAEATRLLVSRKGLNEKLNELNRVREQIKEVSAENQKTQNFLHEAHQKVEKAENTLKGLKDEEKSLSVKVKMQQVELSRLSQELNDLCKKIQQSLEDVYTSLTDDKIEKELNTAEKTKAEASAFYKGLQVYFREAFNCE